MESFVDKIKAVVKEAHEFIVAKVNKEGVITVVKTDERFEVMEEDDNFFYEAPFVRHYGKYGTYDEYVILSLEAKNGEVIVHTKGKGEVDDCRDFELESVESPQLVELADLIR